jgi:hypothetical protein
MFVFPAFSLKMISLKVIHPFKTYKHTESYSPTLTGESFAFTSEVRTSTILEWLKLRIKKYGVNVIFNSISSLLNFMKIYQMAKTY